MTILESASPRLNSPKYKRPQAYLRQWLAQLSFGNKVLLMSTMIALICLILTSFAVGTHQASAFRASLLSRSITLTEITAANSSAALAFDDANAAQYLLANLTSATEVLSAELFTDSNTNEASSDFDFSATHSRPFASFQRAGNKSSALPLQKPGEYWLNSLAQGRLVVVRPVLAESQVVGALRLTIDLSSISAMISRFTLIVAGLILVSVLIAYFVSRVIQRVLTRQVNELVSIAANITSTNNYALRAEVLSQDELGTLAHVFNDMLTQVQRHDAARESVDLQLRQFNETLESRIEARTAQLNERNSALNEALAKLTDTQSQLVQSEKLAALGGLVAGVAHEINTPLGIAVTAASAVEVEAKQTAMQFRANTLSRSAMTSFLEMAEQGSNLIMKNLYRAVELVRSFKQVAVDQSSEQRREIELKDYFQQVLISLNPALKRTHHKISLVCPETLMLDTYPGALYQILVNLVMNSLVHGFAGIDNGVIEIHCSVLTERDSTGVIKRQIEIRYLDNGCGMSAEVKRQVFDPFFTTRRGQGGSGLGMHITWNLATRLLQGSLRCESTPGAGVLFILVLPEVLKDLSAPAVTFDASTAVETTADIERH